MTTQHAAWLMGDSPRLGPGLFSLPWFGLIYAPWKWMEWAWQWRSIDPVQPLWMLSIHEVVYPPGPVPPIPVGANAGVRHAWFWSAPDLPGPARGSRTPAGPRGAI